MNDGQYIRIDELILVTAFVLLIPATLAVSVQLLVFVKARVWSLAPIAAVLSIVVSLVGGVALTLLILMVLPQSMVQLIGLREVPVLGHSITILPLAFFTFGVSVVISTAWAKRRARGAA